jgi:hypothetical protein
MSDNGRRSANETISLIRQQGVPRGLTGNNKTVHLFHPAHQLLNTGLNIAARVPSRGYRASFEGGGGVRIIRLLKTCCIH